MDGYVNLAIALPIQGRRDEALAACRKALEIATRGGQAAVSQALRRRIAELEARAPPGSSGW